SPQGRVDGRQVRHAAVGHRRPRSQQPELQVRDREERADALLEPGRRQAICDGAHDHRRRAAARDLRPARAAPHRPPAGGSALRTRICSTDLASGYTRVLTFGPNIDRSPKFSPDGQRVAFLSDRAHLGDFQLYLLDPETGAARSASAVEGWIEYLHWSPDGTR